MTILTRCLLAALLVLAPMAAWAAPGLAFFGFELVNTSMEPVRADEEERIAMLDRLLADEMVRRGAYDLVDMGPVSEEVEKAGSLRGCNGCELDIGKALGAERVGLCWVQKVSNLILNINLQIREVATGRLVKAGSVDIRGNTDESWRRGLLYLLDHRILDGQT